MSDSANLVCSVCCLRDDARRWLCSPLSPDFVEARGGQTLCLLECDTANQAELLRMNEFARLS